jgi:hypothetical protein
MIAHQPSGAKERIGHRKIDRDIVRIHLQLQLRMRIPKLIVRGSLDVYIRQEAPDFTSICVADIRARIALAGTLRGGGGCHALGEPMHQWADDQCAACSQLGHIS